MSIYFAFFWEICEIGSAAALGCEGQRACAAVLLTLVWSIGRMCGTELMQYKQLIADPDATQITSEVDGSISDVGFAFAEPLFFLLLGLALSSLPRKGSNLSCLTSQSNYLTLLANPTPAILDLTRQTSAARQSVS